MVLVLYDETAYDASGYRLGALGASSPPYGVDHRSYCRGCAHHASFWTVVRVHGPGWTIPMPTLGWRGGRCPALVCPPLGPPLCSGSQCTVTPSVIQPVYDHRRTSCAARLPVVGSVVCVNPCTAPHAPEPMSRPTGAAGPGHGSRTVCCSPRGVPLGGLLRAPSHIRASGAAQLPVVDPGRRCSSAPPGARPPLPEPASRGPGCPSGIHEVTW
ncbi:Hypothetical protein GLP15_3432 [Giardia lamblia P15]|uniref:Uncharacterized protein n=1 Tax=Giardia intestinalis (strain P15) TaxID=658858 RepID=E1F0A6_GIAIA|nr:Hypothetical protein GLP15_3432 [Giardia lamblia P15]